MKVLVGVTGGIAAYKACELVRLLVKAGHSVRCCLTDAGSRFITPLTLATLSGEPCFGANPDYHEWRPNPRVEHVDLAKWADVIAVVPATADIMGKTANGLADDLLSTILLAARGSVLWAPAMNHAMWRHPAVQHNLATLKDFGHHFVAPEVGFLAEGENGIGRLAPVEHIFEAIQGVLGPVLPTLAGRRVLVTAGPTREDLDPARTLTNRSLGSMGIELARAFRVAGAEVQLVLGGDLEGPYGVPTTRVRSAVEMFEVCQKLWPTMDGLVAAAAVADQRPESPSPQKVKKQDGVEVLRLVRTPDILASLAEGRRGSQWCLGFAAESEDLVANARLKLERKRLDAVLVNDISEGKAFGDQANTLIPVLADGQGPTLGPLPKRELATAVVGWWAERLAMRS